MPHARSSVRKCITRSSIGRRSAAIAEALVSRAARAAYAAGAHRMTVGSQVHNQAAHHTYDKLGFVACGLSIGREWSARSEG